MSTYADENVYHLCPGMHATQMYMNIQTIQPLKNVIIIEIVS